MMIKYVYDMSYAQVLTAQCLADLAIHWDRLSNQPQSYAAYNKSSGVHGIAVKRQLN